MAKFHDEFFRQTEGEDALVMKCISERGITQIINESGEQLNVDDLKMIETTNIHIELTRYGCLNKKTMVKRYDWRDYKFEKKHSAEYEVKKFTTTSDTLEKTEVNYEREVICRSNNFIVGYADLIFRVNIYRDYKKLKFDCPFDKYPKIIKDFTTQLSENKLVIEAKPKIKDTAAVLRQIKTYMSLKQIEYGAIVSYSDISQDLIDSLNHENVAYIKMEKTDKPKGLDNFQR